MKRLFVSLIALVLIFSVQMSAQTSTRVARWGVTGGVNFGTAKFSELDIKAQTGWNAGVTCLVDLPLGFSIQPSLVYNQKNTNVSEALVQNVGYLELPVSVQWGPDLLVFRPFLDVTPYIGYGIHQEMFTSLKENHSLPEGWNGKERFEYGLGLGGGINVWKIQVLLRYCWNFGTLYNVHGWDDIKGQLVGLNAKNENFGGLYLGLSFLF